MSVAVTLATPAFVISLVASAFSAQDVRQRSDSLTFQKSIVGTFYLAVDNTFTILHFKGCNHKGWYIQKQQVTMQLP